MKIIIVSLEVKDKYGFLTFLDPLCLWWGEVTWAGEGGGWGVIQKVQSGSNKNRSAIKQF